MDYFSLPLNMSMSIEPEPEESEPEEPEPEESEPEKPEPEKHEPEKHEPEKPETATQSLNQHENQQQHQKCTSLFIHNATGTDIHMNEKIKNIIVKKNEEEKSIMESYELSNYSCSLSSPIPTKIDDKKQEQSDEAQNQRQFKAQYHHQQKQKQLLLHSELSSPKSVQQLLSSTSSKAPPVSTNQTYTSSSLSFINHHRTCEQNHNKQQKQYQEEEEEDEVQNNAAQPPPPFLPRDFYFDEEATKLMQLPIISSSSSSFSTYHYNDELEDEEHHIQQLLLPPTRPFIHPKPQIIDRNYSESEEEEDDEEEDDDDDDYSIGESTVVHKEEVVAWSRQDNYMHTSMDNDDYNINCRDLDGGMLLQIEEKYREEAQEQKGEGVVVIKDMIATMDHHHHSHDDDQIDTNNEQLLLIEFQTPSSSIITLQQNNNTDAPHRQKEKPFLINNNCSSFIMNEQGMISSRTHGGNPLIGDEGINFNLRSNDIESVVTNADDDRQAPIIPTNNGRKTIQRNGKDIETQNNIESVTTKTISTASRLSLVVPSPKDETASSSLTNDFLLPILPSYHEDYVENDTYGSKHNEDESNQDGIHHHDNMQTATKSKKFVGEDSMPPFAFPFVTSSPNFALNNIIGTSDVQQQEDLKVHDHQHQKVQNTESLTKPSMLSFASNELQIGESTLTSGSKESDDHSSSMQLLSLKPQEQETEYQHGVEQEESSTYLHFTNNQSSVNFSKLLRQADDEHTSSQFKIQNVVSKEMTLYEQNCNHQSNRVTKLSNDTRHVNPNLEYSSSYTSGINTTSQSLVQSMIQRQQGRAITLRRMANDSFELSVQLSSKVTVRDVVDVIANPDMLRFWCEPISALVVTDHQGGSSGVQSPQNNGNGVASNQQQEYMYPDVEEYDDDVIVPPATYMEEVQRKIRNQQLQRKQHDGEWIKASTPEIILPHAHTSFLNDCYKKVSTILGFPLYGNVNMYIERNIAQVGFTVGPFKAGTMLSHKMVVSEVNLLEGGGVMIVDEVTIIQEEEEDDGWLLCSCLESVRDITRQWCQASLDGYVDQTKASLRNLVDLVDKGETLAYSKSIDVEQRVPLLS